ncbi:MAG TPA: CHAT domain-containing protein [Thermoanaerobaculia bacterium]|nr:CHAT domain-containing protein [Thermoanaerobaculia bacterium]
MRYRDFDLWIDNRVGDHYPLRAACSAQGEARDRTALDPESGPLQELEARLVLGESGRELLVDFGSLLYSGLFDAENRDIATLFERSRGACNAERDEGLRVRLRIEAPPMAHLPWELLYSRRDQEFLATDAATAVVRYLEVPRPIRSLETAFPVRMLVVIPSVPDLDTAAERELLQEAVGDLERQKLVELTWLDGVVTLDRVCDALVEQRFHILHFIGHGGFDSERPFLIFNQATGEPDYVDHERFGSLFRNHPTMKLIVLNSCQGAEVSSSQPLLGLAPELVKRGIPAVVAMQFPIPDKAAILFAREFYRYLFKGPERGRVEPAICHARNRLAAEFPGHRVVATPVLFTRAPEGVLFDLLTGKRLADTPYSPRKLAGVEAAIKTHEANLALPQSEEERQAEGEELERVRQRLRFRNRSLFAAVLVAFFMFSLSWLRFFDRLPPELKLQSYTSWLGDAFRQQAFSDQISLVATRQKIDRTWRPRHAKLLDRLSEAGAKVVVFDIRFPRQDPSDVELAAAMRRATARGTAVVAAVGSLEGSDPLLSPVLRSALTGWGVACVGQKGRGSSIVPLVTQKRDSSPSQAVPALALAAVLAFEGKSLAADSELSDGVDVLDRATGERSSLGVSDVDNARRSIPGCAIGEGDAVGGRILDMSSREALDRRRRWYESIEASSPAANAAAFGGKIVVVGEQTERESFYVRRGVIREARYGMELHADAVNTLLSGVTIRPARDSWQLIVILLMATAGAGLRYWDRGPAWRRSALAGVVLVYLIGAVSLYIASQLLLNTVFPIGALLLTYFAVGKLKGRWWP